jgi:hypothetical protein
MNAPREVLRTLHRLTAEDRNWIVARLPAALKVRLLGSEKAAERASPAAEAVPVRSAPTPDRDAQDPLASADPKTLAGLLKDEPAWIVAALVCARRTSWGPQLLDSLPAVQRADVARLQTGCVFAPALIEELQRRLAARLTGGPAARSASKFEALVERIGASRSRKRIGIHL